MIGPAAAMALLRRVLSPHTLVVIARAEHDAMFVGGGYIAVRWDDERRLTYTRLHPETVWVGDANQPSTWQHGRATPDTFGDGVSIDDAHRAAALGRLDDFRFNGYVHTTHGRCTVSPCGPYNPERDGR